MIKADLIIKGASEVITCMPELGEGSLGLIPDGAIAVRGDSIVWVGRAADLVDEVEAENAFILDADGSSVIPGFVDSHTHLVFAGDRRDEFSAKASGRPYATSGILTTVEATRAASEDDLLELAEERAWAMIQHGTTTAEAKSGYALTAEGEYKLLQVLSELQVTHPIDIEPTFMGAHLVAPEFGDRSDDYIEEVCNMISTCAPLANWCDVFCDIGAFSVEQAWLVLEAGKHAGLRPRIHANELGSSGGVQVAASVRAASADHLLYVEASEARALAEKGVVGVLCPLTALGLGRFPDARMMIAEGMTLALATDFNPGTAYSENIQLAIAIATRAMQMSPDEAVYAATRGGARALRRDDIGRIAPGCLADILVLETDSYVDLAYHAGVNLVGTLVKRGDVIGD